LGPYKHDILGTSKLDSWGTPKLAYSRFDILVLWEDFREGCKNFDIKRLETTVSRVEVELIPCINAPSATNLPKYLPIGKVREKLLRPIEVGLKGFSFLEIIGRANVGR
jgi:hypothetical protein